MERFLIVYRGAPDAAPDRPERDAQRWASWRESLGSALVEPGALSLGAVEVPNRLLGPKESTSSLSGYSVIQAADFNDAVRLAEGCPIFDEDGSVEIARLGPPLA